MIHVSSELDAVRDQIAEICRRYRIAELSVFGSVARGDDRPDSDVDLLYVSAPDSTGSLWELWELRDELEHLLGRKIDLVPKHNLHWVIRDRVLAEARPVYAVWRLVQDRLPMLRAQMLTVILAAEFSAG